MTGMRIKEFSSGVAIGKGDMPNFGYILGLANRLLLGIIRGLGRETKAELQSYGLKQSQEY